jgi:hypothetical protein
MKPYSATALFDYNAVEDTELTIQEGDVVIVEENNASGWCLATLGNMSGWIPSDYVEKIGDAPVVLEDVGIDELPPPPGLVDEEPELPAPPPDTDNDMPLTQNKVDDAAVRASAIVRAVSNQPNASATSNEADEDAALMAAMNKLGLASSLGGSAGSTAAHAPITNLEPAELPPAPTGSSAATDGAKTCHFCKSVVSSAFVVAKGHTFCANCFKCVSCGSNLGGKPFIEKEGNFYCEDDYYTAFNHTCGNCEQVIKGQYISALDQAWHADCFVCAECQQPFTGNQFRKHNSRPYCEEHFRELFAETCAKCHKVMTLCLL